MWTSEKKTKPKDNLAYKLITVGCDPEFLLVDRGRMFRADTYLAMDGGLGTDGTGRQAELRPRHSALAAVVVQRLQGLIQNAPKKITGFQWMCGNGRNDWTTGGHIHLGFYGMKRGSTQVSILRGDAQPNLVLLLSSLLIPFAVALSNASSLGERKKSYGKIGGVQGEYRQTEYGVEYRPLPSWLLDPWTAYFFLAGAKLIALEYTENKYKVEGLTSMLPLHLLYNIADVRVLKELVLSKLDTYAELMEELIGWDENPQMIRALHHVLNLVNRGQVWDDVGFRQNWFTDDIPLGEAEKQRKIVVGVREFGETRAGMEVEERDIPEEHMQERLEPAFYSRDFIRVPTVGTYANWSVA